MLRSRSIAKSRFRANSALGLGESRTASREISNYPNRYRICEVDLDPSTGQTKIDRYSVVDDVGAPINPKICEGQIHGGIAQGAGQALLECIVYASNREQLLSGSSMDYAIHERRTLRYQN